MNFLSHYYFERNEPDHHLVMGIVLPDLVKNAHKDWNLNPQKKPDLFVEDKAEGSILKGWNRHLEVDRLFHCSSFFIRETAVIKEFLMPALQSGPVKPFFLAHIGLELVLDHLLTVQARVNIYHFYHQLQLANNPSLSSFLEKAGIEDINAFSEFLSGFISSKYILSYQKIENISYALSRICMRLWPVPFNEEQVEILTERLILYRDDVQDRFMTIFDEIEQKLGTAASSC